MSVYCLDFYFWLFLLSTKLCLDFQWTSITAHHWQSKTLDSLVSLPRVVPIDSTAKGPEQIAEKGFSQSLYWVEESPLRGVITYGAFRDWQSAADLSKGSGVSLQFFQRNYSVIGNFTRLRVMERWTDSSVGDRHMNTREPLKRNVRDEDWQFCTEYDPMFTV